MSALLLMAVCPLVTWCVLGQIETHVAPPIDVIENTEGGRAELNFAASAAANDVASGGLTLEQFIPSLQPYLLLAGLVGVWLLGLRLVSGYVGTRWLRSGRTAVPFEFAEKALQIGRRLGIDATDRVFGCSRVSESLALGFWKPIVLIPACWL